MLSPKQWATILEIPAALVRIAGALESIAETLTAKPEPVAAPTPAPKVGK